MSATTDIVTTKPSNKGKRASKKAPTPVVQVTPTIVPVPKADGTKQYDLNAKPPVPKGTKAKSPSELKKEINDLLDELRAADDVDEKKTIRRKLRLRGHYGGLGVKRASTPAKTKAVKEIEDCCED